MIYDAGLGITHMIKYDHELLDSMVVTMIGYQDTFVISGSDSWTIYIWNSLII